MATVSLILLVFAFVLFVLAALVGAPYEPWRFRLIPAGLACWVLSVLLGGVHL